MQDNSKTYCDRLIKGDKKVIDRLYEMYHARIFHFALSFLKNEEDSYDIVQEVFVKLCEKRSSFRKDTNIDALMFTMAKNTILSVFRKRASEQKYIEFLGHHMQINTDATSEQVDYSFLKAQYESVIPQLPTKRKEIFMLSREKGLTNKEIAKLKGISEKTVEDHITKSLAFLKKHISQFGIWAALFYALFIE